MGVLRVLVGVLRRDIFKIVSVKSPLYDLRTKGRKSENLDREIYYDRCKTWRKLDLGEQGGIFATNDGMVNRAFLRRRREKVV